MHFPFEAMAWVQIAHRYADLILLISIATLGLLPLISIYLIETEKLESVSSMQLPFLLRSVLRCLIYIAILFPYLLALLSTYISIQLIRHPRFQQHNSTLAITSTSSFTGSWFHATSFWKFYKNTKVSWESLQIEWAG